MLESEERAFFAEHGWLVLRRAFAQARVDELRAALDAVIPEAAYAGSGARRVVEVASISRGSAAIARHARDPVLGAFAAHALGANRVQVLQDTALIKPAWSVAAVAWHQDYSYLCLEAPRALTARLALTPCTEGNGCLRVIDKSHTWGALGPSLSMREPGIADAFGSLPAELRERALEDEIAIQLQPGDLSLHHCLTLHGSGPNPTAEARKTLVVRLVDGDCRVELARLPDPASHAHFPTDAQGRLSPEAFPIVYDEAP